MYQLCCEIGAASTYDPYAHIKLFSMTLLPFYKPYLISLRLPHFVIFIILYHRILSFILSSA